MKKLWFVLLVAGMLTGCSKDDGAGNGSGNGSNGGNSPALPALPDPNDVCSAMDDIDFMAYCYDNFDVNKDGKVSTVEAEAVREMEFPVWFYGVGSKWNNVRSIKGIEYFPNLEKWYGDIHSDADLDYGFVFQYNKKLKVLSLDCDATSLSVLDLSRFQELEEVHLYNNFGTVSLPKTIQQVSLYYVQLEKLKCYAVTPPELFFHNDDYISTIYVPKDRVAVYQATEPWKQFNIQPL